MKLFSAVTLLFLVGHVVAQHDSIEIINPIIGFNLPENNSKFIVNNKPVIEDGITFPYELYNPATGKNENSIKFRFEVKSEKKLYYKIYYQNEQYKFTEDHKYSSENFYGSFNDTVGFKEVNNNEVVDSFIICGNPRFEKKMFGAPSEAFFIDIEKIKEVEKNILSVTEWKAAIEKKASDNKISFEEQMKRDVLWVLKDNRNSGNVNHRWKRNPRMGRYSAMIVLCTEEALQKIPPEIQRIDKTDVSGKYVNPYSYFLTGNGKSQGGVSIFVDSAICSLSLSIKPGMGIYIDNTAITNTEYLGFQKDSMCGSSSALYKRALFEQFFSHENRDFKINTIPVISDWTKDEYSVSEYEKNKVKYKADSLRVHSWIRNVECPCQTVRDSGGAIELWNPPSQNIKNAAKLNTGVITRVGFTYGKITAKVKFSPQLNKYHVWNGVTNAVWLITQDFGEWNNRRYSESGYTPKGNPKGARTHTTAYSEIDFEIIKASPYWPKDYYQDEKLKLKSQKYFGKNNDTIIVALTNWDLASKDPVKFKYPLQYVDHGKRKYEALRWDELYQALTIRSVSTDTELSGGDFYFYQIEWRPTEIIWRIGPSLDKLVEVGYMNELNTSIPNNQMRMIINQEFHLAIWWPVPVYEQDFIPFMSNVNKGKIYEVTIE